MDAISTLKDDRAAVDVALGAVGGRMGRLVEARDDLG
jgi:hypothetical protein